MGLTCAICHEPTRPMLDFGDMPLANGYAEPWRREPLNIVWCEPCGLYQLAHLVPASELFGDYAYRTGATGQRVHWQLLHDAWRARAPLGADLIVEVGGNDGVALAPFGGARTCVNVDPFAPEQGVAGVIPVREPWNVVTASTLLARYGPSKLVLASNVWAHMPDLHASAQAAAMVLAPDGWLVIQAPWCRDFWRYQLYDTAYHEHIYYLGVQAMRALFQRHGMDVHDIEYLPNVHGGSLRYWIRHGNDGIADSVTRFADMEADSAAVRADVEQSRYVRWRQRQTAYWHALPRPLWGITAPAKATMYLAMTQVGGLLSRLFDDTPAKQGRVLPGTQLVVEPLDNLRSDSDYTAGTGVVFSWNHRAALAQRLYALNFTSPTVVSHA